LSGSEFDQLPPPPQAPVAPNVTGINPNNGPTAGNTLVTITGSGFTGATVVKFGSTAATSVTVISDTSITCKSPAGTGTVDVTVATPVGTSATNSADQFTYVAVGPTVTGINPNSGPITGGTSVTITGTGFSGATSVKFGSNAATSLTINSATSITATSPAESVGTVDVTVTTPVGTSATSSADQFTYFLSVGGICTPTANQTIYGSAFSVTGWYVDTDGIQKIEVYVGGMDEGAATTVAPPASITSQYNYPSYPSGNDVVGFQFSLNTKDLANGGSYSITIQETDLNGNQHSLTSIIKFYVYQPYLS
jgi:hypothetical protein